MSSGYDLIVLGASPIHYMSTATPSLEQFSDTLATRMWRTAGARFNASRRLKLCNHMSALGIALLSTYILAISIVQIRYSEYLKGQEDIDRMLTVVSILGSLLIIIVSLTEWAKDFAVRAERIFNNATSLTNLRTRLELIRAKGYPDDILFEKLDEIRQDYELLTGEGSPNHDPIDDLLFRSKNNQDPHPSFQMSGAQAVAIRAWCHIAPYGFYIAAIVVPPVIVAISMSAIHV